MCRYNMTKFAIYLNEVTPGLKGKLAPTDSRLRPDQHALEQGVYDQVCVHSLIDQHAFADNVHDQVCFAPTVWSACTGRGYV